MSGGEAPRPAGSDEVGAACPYCRFALKAGVEIVACPSCEAVHHEECWTDNGGCAVVGCAEGPEQGPPTGKLPARAPLPPPTDGGAGRRDIEQPAARRRRIAPVLAVLVLVGAIAGGVGGAVVLAGGGDASEVASTAAPAADDGVTEEASTTQPVATVRTVRGPEEGEGDEGNAGGSTPGAAAVELLRRYEAAYSARDGEALRALFTRRVTRRGFQAGGCGEQVGRKEVIEAYNAQFALGTGEYRLSGVTADAVRMDGTAPAITARYQITGGNSGGITFTFAQSRGEWLIDRVESHNC